MSSFTPQQIEEFLQEFFDVVGARQYVGARYVPIFGRRGEDTVEWDDLAPYEPLTVVMHQGVSYVSRQYVPTGTPLEDTDFWVETYRFNAQVEQYRQEVLSFQGQIDGLRSDLESDYVPFPDSDFYAKYGTLGQVLSTLANGETEWVDPVTVDAEVAGPLIDDWLDEHPEATTTVQDGSITRTKLNATLLNGLLHSGNVIVTADNYQSRLTDADLQPNNAVYLFGNNVTSSMVSHLPLYSTIGLLFKVNYSDTNVQGCLQVFVGLVSDPVVYFRFAAGGGNVPTFGPWKKVPDPRGILHSANVIVTASNYQSRMTDADDQAENSVYLLGNDLTSSMVANLPLYGESAVLMKVNYSDTNRQGCLQVLMGTKESPVLWYRVAYGADSTPTFGPWRRALDAQEFDARLPSILHSSATIVSAANYATVLPDADLQPNSTVYLLGNNVTDQMTANLPVYEQIGVLAKVNYSGSNPQGCLQLFACVKDAPELWYRIAAGGGDTPTFGPWERVLDGSDATEIKNSPNVLHATNVIVTASNYGTVLPDADLQANNSMCILGNNVTSSMTLNLPVYQQIGVLAKLNYSASNVQGCLQVFACTKDDPVIWFRIASGGGDVPTFGPWQRLASVAGVHAETLNKRTASIFRKVVCCGDSYTAGWIDEVDNNEDYSWPHYMEVLTGAQYVNCGSSGANVNTWQTAQRGYAKAVQAGPAQAYIIGLMLNDVWGGVPLGSPSDIGTQATTYYGGLSQIVESLHTISPDAFIFIQTCPREASMYVPYNQAVRDVVNYYAATMHTHLLDLYEYMDLYDVPSITGDYLNAHYSAIGYQQFAENLMYVMSDYINRHISTFQHVHLIPTS